MRGILGPVAVFLPRGKDPYPHIEFIILNSSY
jgi:hypothetical protein